MELGHPTEALTDALIDALGHRLPDIEYQFQTPMDRREGMPMRIKKRRPEMRDIEVRMFPETWSSTALGFGGMGGAAMTPAYTVVVSRPNLALVYWGGVFAYGVEPDEAFLADINSGRTWKRSQAINRYKIIP
jgi:hypothetical protein